MLKALNIEVYGKVQGVYFRARTAEKARELNLTGFVRNMPDGSVHIRAEGKFDDLAQLVKWCRDGPVLAKVSSIRSSEASLEGYQEFIIIR